MTDLNRGIKSTAARPLAQVGTKILDPGLRTMALAHRRLHFRVPPRAIIHLFCGGQGFRATVDCLSGETLRLSKPSEWRPNPGELCEVRFAAAGIIYSFSVVAEIVWSSDQAVTMRLRYVDEQRDWQIARYVDGFKNAIAVNEPDFAAG